MRAPVVNGDDDVRISSKFVKDSNGFIRQNKKPSHPACPLTLGRKMDTRIKVAESTRKTKIFVSRLDTECPV